MRKIGLRKFLNFKIEKIDFRSLMVTDTDNIFEMSNCEKEDSITKLRFLDLSVSDKRFPSDRLLCRLSFCN